MMVYWALGRAAGQKIKEQYNCKKEAMRKNWNGQGKIKGGETHGHRLLQVSCRKIWQRGAFDPLID